MKIRNEELFPGRYRRLHEPPSDCRMMADGICELSWEKILLLTLSVAGLILVVF